MTRLTVQHLREEKEVLFSIFEKHDIKNPRIFGELAGDNDHFNADFNLLVEYGDSCTSLTKVALQRDLETLFRLRAGLGNVVIQVTSETGLEESVQTGRITLEQKELIILTANTHSLRQILEEEGSGEERISHLGLFSRSAVSSPSSTFTGDMVINGNPNEGTLQLSHLSAEFIEGVLNNSEIRKTLIDKIAEIDREFKAQKKLAPSSSSTSSSIDCK